MSARRDIPTLDGLRAISILCVIVSHMTFRPGIAHLMAEYPRVLGATHVLAIAGVHVFFVISGYLITTLLLQEYARTGGVSLGRFYFRRSLRIFPPYYVLLAGIALAVAQGWLASPGIRWWPAITYTSNFVPVKSWLTGHTWSLSVEEQFYLVWPAVMLRGDRRRGVRVAALAVALTPLLLVGDRVVGHLLGSSGGSWAAGNWGFHYIAAGCLLALLKPRLDAQPRWQALMATRWAWMGPVFVVALRTFWPSAGVAWVLLDACVLQLLEPLAVVVMIAWCIQNAGSRLGRALDLRPLRAVGVLSYSLYLWQQVFLRPDSPHNVVASLALTFAVATASYFIVERPTLRLRTVLERRVGAARAAQSRAPTVW